MKRQKIRGLTWATAISFAFALLPMLAPQAAKPEASLASAGLDGSKGIMQPVGMPARVSRVAHVPGTGGRLAWAIGHMTNAMPGWGSEQAVFLKYVRGEGWSVFGPPLDQNGNVAQDVVLSNMAFAPNGEGWAVGTSGTLVHYTPDSGWRYQNACAPGGPLEGGCGNLMGVSLTSEGGRTIGYAVGERRSEGSANTILALDGTTWTVDSVPVVPNPNPVIDFSSVAVVSKNDAWAVGGTGSRELQIFKRDSLGWHRQKTNQTIFDNPAPSNDNQNVNLSAIGHAVVASRDGNTVWIGGGIYPVDPGEPLKQADRPFTLRWRSNSNSFESFCPPQYSLHNDNASTIIKVCQEVMPVSTIDITSLSMLDNGEVFAGGLGLFHFKSGVWWREPDAVGYLSSVSFVSAEEGWVASSGNTYTGGRTAASSSTTLGHYIKKPGVRSATAKWPHFNQSVLFGVSVAPKTGEAIAVGNGGVAMLFKPQIGWDRVGLAGDSPFRGVAWADSKLAWAVGERGVMGVYRNGTFNIHPRITDSNLSSIALMQGHGFAVGDRGTILAYRGGSWSKDPSSGSVSSHLYDVAPLGSGFVAVGADATVLVNPSGSPGGWSRDDSLRDLFTPEGILPALFTASGTDSGSLVVGGSRRTLVARRPGEDFRRMTPIDRLEGSIVDVLGFETARGLEVIGAFSPSNERFKTRRTTLMHFNGTNWRDLDLSARQTIHLASDTAAIPDPVFGLAFDESRRRGWAVGGTLAEQVDELGNYQSVPSSAIYRFDLNTDPSPPNTSSSLKLDPQKLSFAYFSDTSCGSGYCSIAVGSGNLADEVALNIRDQINKASRLPGGPKFVVFGGSMRATGIPEELEQFKGYLSDFEIPVFAAVGPQDLFSSGAASQLNKFVPDLPDDDLERAGLKPPVNPGSAAASNRDFLKSFADQFAPWGNGPRARKSDFIDPVERGLDATDGLARTHYAFDYAPGGRAVARFVVLDTSDRFYQKTGQSQANQNPPNQDQSLWLPDVVADARSPLRPKPLPVIVLMNVPTVDPLKAVGQPMLVDGKSFERAVADLGLSVVIAGFIRGNATYPILGATGITPVYILGGGGGPPPRDSTKYVNDGFFNAWGLVEIDSSSVSLTNPRAEVKVSPVPVVESVALHPLEDLNVPGGWTLQFQALGRAIDGGGPPGDPHQKRMSYLHFPPASRCLHEGLAGRDATCLNQSALAPAYRFVSEDPDIAEFVRPGPVAKHPLVLNGFLIPDDQFGFLCTFKAGTAWVKIVAGSKEMRMPVTVGAGFGPCVDHPILIPGGPISLRKAIDPLETPEVPLAKQFRPLFHPLTFPDPLIVALPPVPAPIPAPAPPASAASSRKEEEEAQLEEQGDEGSNEARVLSYQKRSSGSIDPIYGWTMISAATLMGLFGAIAAATIAKRTKGTPSAIYVEQRRVRKKEY